MAAMGKVTISIPLVTWRDGRPRFIPGPAMRKLGYEGEDLRHGAGSPSGARSLRAGQKTGPWFTLEEAIAWSEAREADIEEKRRAIAEGETTQRKTANAAARARAGSLVTVGQVCEAFLQSPRMRGKPIVDGRKKRKPLAANTVRAYRGSARLLERFDDGDVWHAPAAELTGRALDGILDEVEIAHGLAQTRALRAFLSVAFRHGRKEGDVRHNPVAEMDTELPVLEADCRPASVGEIVTLIAVADALGLADAGDVICAGPWTGQRQNDRLALEERHLTAEGIVFEPNKKARTADRLLIPVSAELSARLAAARERRKAWAVVPASRNVFICEATRRPWAADWYRKVFRVIRQVAATGERPESRDTAKVLKEMTGEEIARRLNAAGVTPLASLGDPAMKDKHLRDTCLSWLPLAGADKWEVAGFSGHAFGQEDRVLKHYVAIPPEFARRGMVKLEAWYAAQLAAIGREAEG